MIDSDTLKNIDKSLKKYKEEYKYTPLLDSLSSQRGAHEWIIELENPPKEK